jgi:hypothetical protein
MPNDAAVHEIAVPLQSGLLTISMHLKMFENAELINRGRRLDRCGARAG